MLPEKKMYSLSYNKKELRDPGAGYDNQNYDIYSKWVNFFSKVNLDAVPNILMLTSYVLSIPGSNRFVKRVFSILKNK